VGRADVLCWVRRQSAGAAASATQSTAERRCIAEIMGDVVQIAD
jgi:hypothetical protein